jgi:hypothetical protein
MIMINDILPTHDSGFIAISNGMTFTTVFRMSPSGNIIWFNYFFNVLYNKMVALSDQTIVACGVFTDNQNFTDVYDIAAMRFRLDGIVNWQKSYGDSLFQGARCLVRDNDDNIWMAGQQKATVSSFTDGLLMKIDTSGNLAWAKSFSGPEHDIVTDIGMRDNKLIIAGHSSSFVSGLFYCYLFEADTNGSINWMNSYGQPYNNGFTSFSVLDTGYLVTGFYGQANGQRRAVLMYTDTTGAGNCSSQPASFAEVPLSFSDSSMNTQYTSSYYLVDTNFQETGGFPLYTLCPVTGLMEDNPGEQTVYPNPGKGVYYLSGMYTISQVLITDVLGKKATVNFHNSQFSFSAPPGLYFYRIEDVSGRMIQGRIIHSD